MPRKSRLFASVALPFVSLSLMLQPAHAMTIRPAVDASQTSDVIRVQGAPAPEAETPEELKKKKAAAEAEAPAEKPARAEKPAAAEPEAPAARPPRAEKPAAAEEVPAAPAEKPARAEKPAAPEEKPAPSEKPEAPARKPAAAEEKQEAPPRKPAAAEQPAEAPAKPAKKPAAEAAPATEPAAKAPAAEAQPAVPAPAAAPVPKTSPVEEPVAKPPVPKASPIEEPAAKPPVPSKQPDATPGRQPADGAERPAGRPPAADPAAGEQPATPGRQRPPRPAAAGEQPPAGAAAPVPGQPSVAPSAGGQPAAPGQPTAPPAPGQPAVPGQPQAPGQPPMPDASGGQGAQAAPPPMTPAQLDQARKIADNPKASTETVILPVQNGAAVLDSDKDAARPGGAPGSREDRRKERADAPVVAAPKSDADAQVAPGGKRQPPIKMEAVTAEQGQRLDRRPDFQQQPGMVEQRRGDNNRIIVQIDNQNVIRNDDSDRFTREGEEQYYERLPGGRTRETISRPDRSQVVTIRNRYGDLVQRSRIDARGREYVLFYAPELMEEPDRAYEYRDPGEDLPPMRLNIPVRDYIIDTTSQPDRDYYKFLEQPPVEPVERVYSLDEVKYSARIRDKVRRIDLDTITFPTGSAEISMNQAASLRKVADAINQVLKKNPAETFLIEGHTDAVGSDESNLVLSDQRAESVANVLTDAFAIPPENLATQGYGERYLKVSTAAAEQQNRRVTIRRVTALVRPVAQK